MAKCWCRLELVAGYVKDATRDHPAYGCPVHGEDYRLSQEQVIALVEAVKASKHCLEHFHGVSPCPGAQLGDLRLPDGAKPDESILGTHTICEEVLAGLPEPKGEDDG